MHVCDVIIEHAFRFKVKMWWRFEQISNRFDEHVINKHETVNKFLICKLKLDCITSFGSFKFVIRLCYVLNYKKRVALFI